MKVFGPLGKGETLLFVHGALSDGQMWEPHMQIAAEHFQSLSYTQRFFGEGNPQAAPQTKAFGVADHAADLMRLIESLNRTKVHLVGWSYGADVCLAAAALIPERIASIFAYEPGQSVYFDDADSLARYTQDIKQAFSGAFAASQAGDWALAARQLIDASAQESGYFEAQPEAVKAIQQRNFNSLPLQLNQVKWEDRHSLQALNAWGMSITLAYGEDSRLFFKEATKAAAKWIRISQLAELPNATHMLPLEDPETFMRAILHPQHLNAKPHPEALLD